MQESNNRHYAYLIRRTFSPLNYESIRRRCHRRGEGGTGTTTYNQA